MKRDVGLKLTVAARYMRTAFDHRVERIDLSGAKWTLIAVVSRNPGATQRWIASALNVTEVTAGRLIDRLCEAGYLERRPHPQDRRAYRVYLTPAARPVLRQLKHIAALNENEAFAGLSESELKTFDSLLNRVNANLSKFRDAKFKDDPRTKPARSAGKR